MRTRSGSERGGSANLVRVPHDPVNEVVLLAAAMTDERAAKYLQTIPADSFFGKGHAAAWEALQEVRRRGLEFDLATVRQVAGDRVDVTMLEEYLRARPQAPPNLKHHAECIAWDRARVEATRGPIQAFLEALRDPSSSPDAVRGLALRVKEAFDGHGSSRYLRDPGNLIREQSAELARRREGQALYPYGIEGLDRYADGRPRMMPGAAPKLVTLVVGVSGSGKSTFTAHLALAAAAQGRRVLYGAWEQDSGRTLELLATLSLQMSRSCVTMGDYTEADQRDIEEEMGRLSQWIRMLDNPFGRKRNEKASNDRNLDIIHQHIADAAPDVFIADLLKKAFVATAPDDEELALNRMQTITQEERCHSIWVQQLRLKDLEQREDKRPTREGIKGSGAWVEVPDTIIGLHRPALFKNVPDDKIQTLVLKQRDGVWPLAVEYDWEPEYGAITRGLEVEYDRPGTTSEDSIDGMMDKETEAVRKARSGGRKKKR